jgi:hypothetical protein
MLTLRMKAFQQLPSCEEDSSCALDTLAVMTSQDAVYRCRDYLARDRSSMPCSSLRNPLRCYAMRDECVDTLCREKMCDWSYRVCDHFNASREIVAIAFSYLDRFFDNCFCDRTTFKLASMTSMYMATKVFNSTQISIVNLAALSRGEFSVSHIADMEKVILDSLGWRMNPPTCQAFIARLCRLLPVEDSMLIKIVYRRATFLAELCVFDYAFVPEERYVVAVACIIKAIDIMDKFGCQKLPSEFLSNVSSNLCVDVNHTALERVQVRLGLLYECSAQVQNDYSMSPHSRKEHATAETMDKWISVAALSPTSVGRPF